METTRYKVLLIEDDSIDQMAFERLVRDESLPYDYTIAGSVSEANSILGADRFDIIISDYSLGDGTAFDILDSIKETPVIFATGAGNEELAVKAMKVGACDYLIKDSERSYLKVLPEIVKNAVSRRKIERELKEYHDNLEALVKERTRQLAAEKELLSVTLSSMGDAVVVVDAEKRINLFNKVAQELTGWKFEQVQGKLADEFFKLINEKTKAPVESPIDKVFASGRIETGNIYDALIAKDGSECPISATAAPIYRNGGAMLGVVMVLRDVLREREIDRMKTDFVSSVSHELRTPLTSIKAYIATILRDPDMPERTKRQFLSIIDEESNHLADLIQDVLEISRIESGSIKIARQKVDITFVIERVITALEPLADSKSIRLKSNIPDELPELQADESRIQSVIMNLLDNAIKFAPQKGQVSINVQCRGQELAISVSDTGLGIPKEALVKVFDRFYRVHRPGKQIRGTGLGLAIVKKIVMMHGGRIELDSELNHGSTFTVILPLAAQPAEAAVVEQK